MLEDTIWDIREMPTRVVTADYMDQQYQAIYKDLYSNKVLQQEEALLRRVQVFSIDLCMYLRGCDLSTKNVEINIGYCYTPVSWGYVLSGILLYLEFSNTSHIMLRLLDYQQFRAHTEGKDSDPLIWYTVSACNQFNSIYGDVHRMCGHVKLATTIHRLIGWNLCASCHYANEDVDYCGLALPMYTSDCSKARPNKMTIRLCD